MICLVNPHATDWKARIPLSILSIAASLEGAYPYEILDGNLERGIFSALPDLIRTKAIRYVGFTVMPGPQLTQSILLSKLIRREFPSLKIIWGGYFPSLHTDVVLQSPYVDYVIRDQGDYAFKNLIDCLEHGGALSSIAGLSYRDERIVHNERQKLIDPNTLPLLPYGRVDVPRYIGKTCLGSRTVNYHSSVGCPFLCGFCAVAVSYRARWQGLEPERVASDLRWFKKTYGVNAVEFHDNNFFTSEQRTREFAERIAGEHISWWGEARPDTLLHYDERTWESMRRGGCAMIFMGAESGTQQALDLMDKGGTQTPETILSLAALMKGYGIVPEFSFVLGSPTTTVEKDIEQDIRFIKSIKNVNPDAEIIVYIYSPVHFEEADLYQVATKHHFAFPTHLDDWLLPEWAMHDLKKRPVTPWLSQRSISRIRNFERVLNAAHPTRSDLKLTAFRKKVLGLLGGWRYHLSLYAVPYEVALVQRLFRYRAPEIEGF